MEAGVIAGVVFEDTIRRIHPALTSSASTRSPNAAPRRFERARDDKKASNELIWLTMGVGRPLRTLRSTRVEGQ